MPRRAKSSEPIYHPQVGEVVRDLVQPERRGVFMASADGLVYLRPEGGGVEWETLPHLIQPLDGAKLLVPVVRESFPRFAECVTLPEGS